MELLHLEPGVAARTWPLCQARVNPSSRGSPGGGFCAPQTWTVGSLVLVLPPTATNSANLNPFYVTQIK